MIRATIRTLADANATAVSAKISTTEDPNRTSAHRFKKHSSTVSIKSETCKMIKIFSSLKKNRGPTNTIAFGSRRPGYDKLSSIFQKR